MIGAMLVLLLGIGAFVGFRALNRDELVVEPERVDYLTTVRFAQDSDWVVAYPTSVPDDWTATSVDAATEADWGIGFVTPDGFAGLRQSDGDVASLLATYVDEDVTELDPVTIEGTEGEWRVYEDAGGDLGYLGEVEGERVLVYGSGSAEDLAVLAAALTTEPVG